MILGFTGTKIGMTQKQRETVRYLFHELQLRELHHGDCVGADKQAHGLARALGARIVLHPPTDAKLRAFCDADEAWPEMPYLARNRRIVDEVKGLIAAPRSKKERVRGSGTWTTVRYARKAHLPYWLVFPDGTFEQK